MEGILTLLLKPQARNWSKAMDLLVQLTGADESENTIKRQKTELEKLKTEIKKLKMEIEPPNDNDQVMEFIEAMTNGPTEQEAD